MRCAARFREAQRERCNPSARVATRRESACGRPGAIGKRLARGAFARLRILQRARAPNRSCPGITADGSDFTACGPCFADAIPRAAARHGVARARTEAPHVVARVRSFVGVWNRQRSLCLAAVRMVWPSRRRAQARMGNWLWPLVDDSRALRRDCDAPGERAALRRTRLDETSQLKSFLES